MPKVGFGFPGFEQYAGKFAPLEVELLEAGFMTVLTVLGDVWWHPTFGTTFWEALLRNVPPAIIHMREQIAIGIAKESHRMELVNVDFDVEPNRVHIIVTMTIRSVQTGEVFTGSLTVSENGIGI